MGQWFPLQEQWFPLQEQWFPLQEQWFPLQELIASALTPACAARLACAAGAVRQLLGICGNCDY